jgi:RimJ/RimL family protein N-acetyltransferase
MHLLSQNNYFKVIPLFESFDYNKGVIFSVIEGNSVGKIYVDNLEAPKSAFLYPLNSFYYIAGDYDNQLFNSELYNLTTNFFKREGDHNEIIIFSCNEEWRNTLDLLFEKNNIKRIKRTIFNFNKFNFEKLNIVENESIVDFDENIIKNIGIANSWISIEKFFNNGIGKALLFNNEIISACYSIYYGNNEMEIDVFTHEKYQKKGFAKLVAYKFISKCLENNFIPAWSCWSYKESSKKLAFKLGFEEIADIDAHLLIL